ncbi:DUF2818 family protein [Acidovorax lacteus]|uniref:DUF2818 family protein n=1 Tax=Acidovorax lacteus TaxID=1924988 RepID=A0ABP8LFY0_9BURK
MSQTGAIWLVIVCALLAANLPFINQRVLAFGPAVSPRKALWVHLLELMFWYGVVGALGYLLERRAGQNAPQGWEFYVVTASLFLTLAFPGFVYRYLAKRTSA